MPTKTNWDTQNFLDKLILAEIYLQILNPHRDFHREGEEGNAGLEFTTMANKRAICCLLMHIRSTYSNRNYTGQQQNWGGGGQELNTT